MNKFEAYDDFFSKKESVEKSTEKEVFFAGWDACENVWLTDEPDKDLMISELEGKLKDAERENYKKKYISSYEMSSRYLSILAQISTAQGNENLSETEKLEHIRKLLDKVPNNKINEGL